MKAFLTSLFSVIILCAGSLLAQEEPHPSVVPERNYDYTLPLLFLELENLQFETGRDSAVTEQLKGNIWMLTRMQIAGKSAARTRTGTGINADILSPLSFKLDQGKGLSVLEYALAVAQTAAVSVLAVQHISKWGISGDKTQKKK